MDTTSKIQFYIFLTSVYGGLIAGLAYDIYKTTRIYFRPRKLATLIEDFVFWIGIGLIFFYLLNKNDWFQLRAYVFLGFFMGGFLYLKLLSRFLSPILLKVSQGLIYIGRGIKNIFLMPFRKIRRITRPILRKIRRFSRIPQEARREIKKYKKIIFKK